MRTLIRIVALFTLLAGTMLATGQASAQSVVSIADATVTEGVFPAQTINLHDQFDRAQLPSGGHFSG